MTHIYTYIHVTHRQGVPVCHQWLHTVHPNAGKGRPPSGPPSYHPLDCPGSSAHCPPISELQLAPGETALLLKRPT